jgi:hypothetical protein
MELAYRHTCKYFSINYLANLLGHFALGGLKSLTRQIQSDSLRSPLICGVIRKGTSGDTGRTK